MPLREAQEPRRVRSRTLIALATLCIALPACWGDGEQSAVIDHRFELMVSAGATDVRVTLLSRSRGWPRPVGGSHITVSVPQPLAVVEVVRTAWVLDSDPARSDAGIESRRIRAYYPEELGADGHQLVRIDLAASRQIRVELDFRLAEPAPSEMPMLMKIESGLFSEDEDINCRSATEPTIDFEVEDVEGGTITELPADDP